MSYTDTDIEKYFVPIKANVPGPKYEDEDIEKYFEPEQEKGGLIGTPRQLKMHTQEAISRGVGSLGDLQQFIEGIFPEKVQKAMGQPLIKLPTSEDVREKINEAFQGKYAPESQEELEQIQPTGTFASLVAPGPGKVSAARAGLATAAGEIGKKGAELLGFNEDNQGKAQLILQTLPLIVSGKLKPSSEEQKILYETGKKAGLSDELLTPLMQSEKKLGVLGRVAKPTQELEKKFSNIWEGLGKYYESLKSNPKSLEPLSQGAIEDLSKGFGNVVNELEQTVKAAPDKASAINYIKDSIEELNSKPITGKSLINFWQDINQSVDWSKIKGGKKSIAALKEPILNELYGIHPELAKQFQATNKLYQKAIDFEDKVGLKNLEAFVEIGQVGKFLDSLIHFNLGSAAGTLGGEVGRKVATKMLTDPNWQNIRSTTARAIVNKSPKIAELAVSQIKDKVKEEMPEEYGEIEWPK